MEKKQREETREETKITSELTEREMNNSSSLSCSVCRIEMNVTSKIN